MEMMGLGNLDIKSAAEALGLPAVKSSKPEIGLEWTNVNIKFRVVGQDFNTNNEEYSLFPILDPSAPSYRSLTLQKRLQKRTQNDTNTLSGYIGSSSTTSGDNQSVAGSEHSSDKKSSSENKPVKNCPICKKVFTKAAYLKRHILAHSSVKPYKCEICNWGFYQQCNLKRHMASHNNDAGEAFNCKHCQATFTTKAVLSVHLRDAHGEKTPPAAANTNTGSRKNGNHQSLVKTPNKSPHKSPNLVRSPTTPTNMNKCSICGKQFLTQANLRAHLLYHRGHKSFKCSVCGSRFAQKSNLRKHMMLSHSGHQCPHCTVLFRSEQDLSQHIASLHPEVANVEVSMDMMEEASVEQLGDEEPMLKLDDEEEEELNA